MGESEKRLRQYFEAPHAATDKQEVHFIIFDEIDAIFRERGRGDGSVRYNPSFGRLRVFQMFCPYHIFSFKKSHAHLIFMVSHKNFRATLFSHFVNFIYNLIGSIYGV